MPGKRYKTLKWLYVTIGIALLVAGFFSTLYLPSRYGGDGNWFARSGGLVTIFGVLFSLAGEARKFGLGLAEQWILRLSNDELQNLHGQFPTPVIEEAIAQVGRELGQHIEAEKREIKYIELGLAIVGSLVWALGDLLGRCRVET